MPKEQPCCARSKTRLHTAKQELARQARVAAYRKEKGWDLTANLEAIAECRESVARERNRLVEHEAEHAGVPA